MWNIFCKIIIIFAKTKLLRQTIATRYLTDHSLTRSNQSIKIGKSDLIDINYIDQSVEIDDTLVSFIDLSRFYRFHRFISEDTSVLLFSQKWKLISGKLWICWQLSCNWESKDQTICYHFFKKKVKKKNTLKPALKSSSDSRYWPDL